MRHDITIRDAHSGEATFVVGMIRRMVTEMEDHGGHRPASSPAAWQTLTDRFATMIGEPDRKYLVAETVGAERIGFAAAEIATLGGAFEPEGVLNLEAVYVAREFRRSGVATRLIAKILDWGRAAGTRRCSLTVLAGNPAQSLYKKFGFAPFQLQMTCSLARETADLT